MNYSYERGKTIAIIPARSGSKGIKDKNITAVKAFPLMAYSIAAGKLTDSIDRIVVSTDSPKYAAIAKAFGAEVPFLRPPEIAGDDSKDIDYLRHTLEGIQTEEKCIPEFVVLLRPTTPLRNTDIIKNAMEMLKDNPDASAVVSVHMVEECPYKWMAVSKAGYLESPFAELLPDDVNLPRQKFQKIYEPDGYVDVLRSKVILEDGFVYGPKALPYFIDGQPIDIDSNADLDFVKGAQIEQTALYRYLQDTTYQR